MSCSKPIRILYMEDDAGLARLLQKSLQRQGYIVDIACNGEEGLAILNRDSYDILLIDYNMPVYGGLDVIRTLSSKATFPPAIMVTGYGNEKVAVEALKMGAADYIVKDVEMGYFELIPIVIEQVLQKQKLVMEKQQMFEAIQESEERYRRLVELSPDGIFLHVEDKFVFVNPAGTRLLGAHNSEELLGKSLLDFFHPDYRQIIKEKLNQVVKRGSEVYWTEEKLIRLNKTKVDVEISAISFKYMGNPAVQIIARDITERKLAEQRLKHLAHFDITTGIPNRILFFDRLNHTLAMSKRYDHTFALLFLDLDQFKLVNDTFGHDTGDILLKEVSKRLTDCVRESDTLARMSGDEFTIILTKINKAQDVEIVVQRIIASLAKPFHLKGHEASISASIGISLYPSDGDNIETLLKKADTAMYRVKEQGRNNYQFFTKYQDTIS
ncbi:MAG: diguanylate cyclase [Nitrospirae bacterium RBG_13_39_12]|nr:MAG: diguanylate cyclase [Nitrospirae bacterium RBG_13_39_12]